MVLGSLFIGVIYFLPWRFQVNDDVIMMWLVSGSYTGTPESYAVFIHPLLSALLSNLYQLNLQIQWYALYTFCTLWISFLMGIKSIASSKLSQSFQSTLKVAILAITIHFCIFPQFTLLAGWAAINGLLFILLNQSNSWKNQLPGFLLFFLSAFIRVEASGLILLGILVFNIPLFSKKLIPLWTICCLLILISVGSQKIWEANSDYREYLEFNRTRALVFDHPVFFQKYKNDETEKDSPWYFFSQQIIDRESHSIQEIEDYAKELNKEYWQKKYVFESFYRLFEIGKYELFKTFISGILVLLFLLSAREKKIQVLTFCSWMTFFLIFNHFFHLKGRVVILFFLPLFYPIISNKSRWFSIKFSKFLTYLLMIALSFHFSNFLFEAKKRRNLLLQYEALTRSSTISSIKLENFPLEYFTQYFQPNQTVPFILDGWLTDSPFQLKARQKMGIIDLQTLDHYLLIGIQERGKFVYSDYIKSLGGPSTLVRMEKTEDLILFEYKK